MYLLDRQQDAGERVRNGRQRQVRTRPRDRSETAHVSDGDQLAALARLDRMLEEGGIDYWLFGGWAVDFHAGSVTRAHSDLDLAVWHDDRERIAALLATDGWEHAPEEGEDGYTGYARGSVRLELAFLARGEEGQVYTPLRKGRAAWPDRAFENDVAELDDVRARVMSLAALREDKSQVHADPTVAAKDRADLATLTRSEGRRP
jgi:Aminoglycoside-2''-adenylyltransferase